MSSTLAQAVTVVQRNDYVSGISIVHILTINLLIFLVAIIAVIGYDYSK